jgi:hypothetical protein
LLISPKTASAYVANILCKVGAAIVGEERTSSAFSTPYS